MGWESSGVVGFDLGPLLQGQTSIAKPKHASSTLQLKTYSQLIQSPFTGTDCFFHFKVTLVMLTWSFQENFSSPKTFTSSHWSFSILSKT